MSVALGTNETTSSSFTLPFPSVIGGSQCIDNRFKNIEGTEQLGKGTREIKSLEEEEREDRKKGKVDYFENERSDKGYIYTYIHTFLSLKLISDKELS